MRVRRALSIAVLCVLAVAPASAAAPDTRTPPTPAGSDIIAVLEERAVGLRAEEAKLAAAIAESEAALFRLEERRIQYERTVAELTRRLESIRAQRARHASAMLEIVAGSYVGKPNKTDALVPEPGRETDALMAQSLSGAAAEQLRQLVKADEREQIIAEKQLRSASSSLAAVLAKASEVSRQRDAQVAQRQDVQARIAEVRKNIAKQGAVALLPGVDVPVVALDAHLRAARRMATIDGACRVTWWILAAIGAVESANAKGRRIDAEGNVEPIIGPVLDGTGGTAEIQDTDKGVLDGDEEWDHAVGPMQFIPTTWERWASDGNGDGERSPANLYDASLSSARYLCASRGADPLDSTAGLARAAFEYNHSLAYVAHVLRTASEFQKADFVPARQVALAVGQKAATAAGALLSRLRSAGWEPELVGVGDTAALEAKLVHPDGVPVAIRGTVVVIGDSAADRDVLRLIEAAAKSTAGLRTVVVLPVAAVAPVFTRGVPPNVTVVGVAAPWVAPGRDAPPPAPTSTAAGATPAEPVVAWLDQLMALMG